MSESVCKNGNSKLVNICTQCYRSGKDKLIKVRRKNYFSYLALGLALEFKSKECVGRTDCPVRRSYYAHLERVVQEQPADENGTIRPRLPNRVTVADRPLPIALTN